MFAAQQMQVGQVLAGKYQVEQLLGQGGMGVVVAARHVHLGERVAIKLMHPEAASLPGAVARFVREARAAARLQSAHVARVTDVGMLEDERPYMVMEYLEGSDLEALLTASGPLSTQTAVDYVLQAAEAITEAHSLGIVHRDLKPSNLFLTERRDRLPLIKVLDFGISKVVDAAKQDVTTTTSSLMGSPLYMSPEQLTAQRDVDARSDIWALGVILFELVVGAPPFTAETLPQLCALILQHTPDSLSARRPDAPEELSQVVARCLEKSPSARYQNTLELALALHGLASAFGLAAIDRILALSGAEPLLRSARPEPSFGATAANTAPMPERAGRRAAIYVGGAALLVVVAGAFAALRVRAVPAHAESSGGALVSPPPLPQTAAAAAIATAPVQSFVTPATSSAALPKRSAPKAPGRSLHNTPAQSVPAPAKSSQTSATGRAARELGGRL